MFLEAEIKTAKLPASIRTKKTWLHSKTGDSKYLNDPIKYSCCFLYICGGFRGARAHFNGIGANDYLIIHLAGYHRRSMMLTN